MLSKVLSQYFAQHLRNATKVVTLLDKIRWASKKMNLPPLSYLRAKVSNAINPFRPSESPVKDATSE